MSVNFFFDILTKDVETKKPKPKKIQPEKCIFLMRHNSGTFYNKMIIINQNIYSQPKLDFSLH